MLSPTLPPNSSPPESLTKPASSIKRHQAHGYKTRPPLSALTYYRRNASRTLPVGGAIVISVFLIAGIVSLLNSVDRSITVNYGFTRHLSVLTTQLIKDVPPRVKSKAMDSPHVGRVIEAIPYIRALKTVFGQMPVPVYGLDRDEIEHLLRVTGNRVVAGRFPRVGEPEVMMSRAWANNYGAKLGALIKPLDDNLPTITTPQRLVGILEGGAPLAVADKDYLLLELPEPVIRPTLLMLPDATKNLPAMNRALNDLVEKPQSHGLKASEVEYVKFFSFAALVQQLRDTLGFLYQFLTIADALVISAVALLSGFLANIYFEGRLSEFGLLAAFGFRRERLARRVMMETGILVVVGWALGLALTWLIFWLLDLFYMTPRGLILAMPDWSALAYTAPIPFLVGIASLATVLSRLYKLDPIEIMERR